VSLRLKVQRKRHYPQPTNLNPSTRRLLLLATAYRWQHLLRSWHICEQRMQHYKNNCPGKKRNSVELVVPWEV
jgi:hypothetical protein